MNRIFIQFFKDQCGPRWQFSQNSLYKIFREMTLLLLLLTVWFQMGRKQGVNKMLYLTQKFQKHKEWLPRVWLPKQESVELNWHDTNMEVNDTIIDMFTLFMNKLEQYGLFQHLGTPKFIKRIFALKNETCWYLVHMYVFMIHLEILSAFRENNRLTLIQN